MLVLIKITKYIRINILTILIFIVCAITHSLNVLCVTYAVMLAHELAHTLAAICIGLKVSHISFYPFGVNLKLKNKMIYSLADEIILYISGPLSNIVFALITMVIYHYHPYHGLKFLYISNIMLFAMNMIPAIPLDGGVILKKILSRILGARKTERIMKIISFIVSVLLMSFGGYVLYTTKLNFSIMLFSMLMLGNIFTQNEKYDVDFVKELMFHSKKKKDKIKHIIVEESNNYCDIVKKLDKKSYNVIYLTDKKGEIKDILTETQVINKLTE